MKITKQKWKHIYILYFKFNDLFVLKCSLIRINKKMDYINLNNNHVCNNDFKHKSDEKLIDLDKQFIDLYFLTIFLVYILQISNNQQNLSDFFVFFLFNKSIFGQPQKSQIVLGDYL